MRVMIAGDQVSHKTAKMRQRGLVEFFPDVRERQNIATILQAYVLFKTLAEEDFEISPWYRNVLVAQCYYGDGVHVGYRVSAIMRSFRPSDYVQLELSLVLALVMEDVGNFWAEVRGI